MKTKNTKKIDTPVIWLARKEEEKSEVPALSIHDIVIVRLFQPALFHPQL
jgi:hypothetical protein